MNSNEWKTFKLEDVTQYSKNRIELVELNEFNYISTENMISEKGGVTVASSLPKVKSVTRYNKGDILISNIRPYFKKIWYADKVGGTSNDVLVFHPSKLIDSKFLYYYLSQDSFFDYMTKTAKGTKMPRGDKKALMGIDIQLPSLEEQKVIADILSSLDDKIELNNEMNETLEEMAQALFKRWFVDFEFPNEEGQPYKSNGGEMIESELGMIPKGWESYSLYDLGDYINGTSFKKHDYSEDGIPIIKIAELKQGITLGTRYFKGEKDKKYYLKNGDILFSWSGNPDTSIDTFIWHRGEAILNQHIFKVVPNFNVNRSYIYSLLKYLKPLFTETARNKQTTGLGHITIADLKRIKIHFDKETCIKFHSVCGPIINRMIDNNLENNMLINMRDILLPKLMSGEIRVNDLEG